MNDQTKAEFDAYAGAYDAAVNDAIAFSGWKVGIISVRASRRTI